MSEGLYSIIHASTGVLKKSCLLKAVHFPLTQMTWLRGMWGSCSTAAKHFRFLVCDTVSLGEWSLLIQRILMPSSSRINSTRSLTAWVFRMKTSWSFETSWIIHPMTQCDIPEDFKSQLYSLCIWSKYIKKKTLIINDRQYTHFKMTWMFKFVEIRF